MPTGSPWSFLRRALVGRVRAVFHDPAAGIAPVSRSAEAWFAPDSVTWRVHGDVAAMMVGGIAALLLQMLHPLALAGVLGHSNFRQDRLGRLRRTARFIATTTYAHRDEAEAAVARVNAIHARVRGIAPDGRAYAADDPRLLAWIHVAEALSFHAAYVRYADPLMPRADADRYFAEFAHVARRLGADPVPTSLGKARALLASFRGELRATADTREVADLILGGGDRAGAAAPVHALLGAAAVDLLPGWARTMLDLRRPVLGIAPARLTTFGLAATLRWAFAAA